MKSEDLPIEALLARVEKPARYLGTEIGVVQKDWDAAAVRWLLVLPDLYEIGMSHQGLRILYDILNRRPDALAERAFAPWIDMEAALRDADLPFFSLESRHSARDFDIVGFSLQYELLVTNILNLLDLSGIPLLSAERGERDPLIAAGGPCSGNPEPLAEIIDFFLIGDGEEKVAAITESVRATCGRPRHERLRALAEIEGVYVPRFYDPVYAGGRQIGVTPREGVAPRVRRTHLRDLDTAPPPARPVIPMIEAIQDRLVLEIQRGCTQGCRFCHAGIFYRPVRERSPRSLIDAIRTSLPATGWNEISLSSLSSADYSQIHPLAETLTTALAPARIGLSFSSLRVDAFSVGLAELVAQVRKTGFTFAPEAGSQRLRDVINKRVSEEEMLASIEAAYAKGWRRVKLYFMVGLPTETQADLDALVALAERIREIGRRYGGAHKATFSLGAFVPKAHTPFQWSAFENLEVLRARFQFLKERIQSRWTIVKWHDPQTSVIEAIISRGDRRLTQVFLEVWRQGGRFDGWGEHFKLERWQAAFAATGHDMDAWTGALAPDQPLAWDHIDLGVEQAWLEREWERAHAGQTTADCRNALCTACGLGCGETRFLTAPLDAAQWQQLAAELATTQEDPAATDETYRYRITFAKTGRLRFISHLEMGRLFARLFRMAAWPVAYSIGHHPHPKLGYGPPLPLGVEGARELIDVTLTRPLDDAMIARFNGHAPDGLKILGHDYYAQKPVSLAAAAVFADYRVALPDDLHAQAQREGRVEAFYGAGAVIALKASKGRQKTIDLKRCVTRIEWTDDALCLDLRLQEPSGHVLGPLHVLREIFKWSDVDLGRCRVTRLLMRTVERKPFG